MIVPSKYRSIVDRVDEVENRRKPRTQWVWRECHERHEQASARHVAQYPEDAGCEFITIGWKLPSAGVAVGEKCAMPPASSESLKDPPATDAPAPPLNAPEPPPRPTPRQVSGETSPVSARNEWLLR